ncbi:MAG: 50S ribosomal protein L13 [Candidatus Hadarchaeales archaeon]
MLVIDATDLILGRMASFVAKRLLEGERVAIVNAERAVISGKREATFKAYDAWMEIRNLVNPKKGPFHPRRPDALVRLTVRGMLPFDKPRGREAYRRLRVYTGVPPELKDMKFESIPDAHLSRLRTGWFIRVGELSQHLGAKF